MLETVRELKGINVDVYFEKENIHSLSGDGELMLTILASFAQEESRSVSENCKWRIRKGFADGELLNLRFIYGYRIKKDKTEIYEDEAEIVRMIFNDYISGMGCSSIAKKLREMNIPKLRGGTWSSERVAAYARVSTDNDEQLSSYEAQVDYYTRHIKSNLAWSFVNIYSDEGISATSTKKREGFNKMIKDSLEGKIDLIITKSVSRFARNTVDTLTTVRKLKEKGVEVYFEKENIYTLDSKGELLITIMSSLAQEESRSISENVTWGQRKRFADGKVSLPYKLFLDGKTVPGIAKHLTANKIPIPAGKEVWQTSTVLSILQNEKYKGDAILQKSSTVDFLTKKKKINEGEIPQYYVQNSHPAIITPEVYDLVQQEIKKRKDAKGYKTGGSCFSGKIVCGECGSFYGSKVWHSTSKYRRVIWQCNNKFKSDEKCNTPHLYEDKLKQAFVEAFNSIIENKEEILKGYEGIIQALMDTSKLDKENTKLQSELEIVTEMLRKCVEENAHSALDQAEYDERYNALATRYEGIKKDIAGINEKRLEGSVKHESIVAFIKELEQRDGLITEFDEELWNGTVDKVVVNTEEKITFVFKDGMELDWNI